MTVREGASVGGEFSVMLKGPPTGNVTITFAPPGGENLGFDPSQPVFTKDDWRPVKRVSVRQDDATTQSMNAQRSTSPPD